MKAKTSHDLIPGSEPSTSLLNENKKLPTETSNLVRYLTVCLSKHIVRKSLVVRAAFPKLHLKMLQKAQRE